VLRVNQPPPNDSFQKKEPNPRNEKNQKCGKKPKVAGKNLNSPAENPDCFPYKKLRKNHHQSLRTRSAQATLVELNLPRLFAPLRLEILLAPFFAVI
jgi:hypothetical protein